MKYEAGKRKGPSVPVTGRWWQFQVWQRAASIVPVPLGAPAFQLEKTRPWQRTGRKHPQLPPHPPLPVALPDGGEGKKKETHQQRAFSVHIQSLISEAPSGRHVFHLLFDEWKYCKPQCAEQNKTNKPTTIYSLTPRLLCELTGAEGREWIYLFDGFSPLVATAYLRVKCCSIPVFLG